MQPFQTSSSSYSLSCYILSKYIQYFSSAKAMCFLHLRVALTALGIQHPQHYIYDNTTKNIRTKNVRISKRPIISVTCTLNRRNRGSTPPSKRLQSTAFVNAIQNLFESKTKTSVRPARNIQMPLPSSKGFA